MSCHTINDHGGAAGPDLSEVNEDFEIQDIIRKLINPSETLNPDYPMWTIETKDFEMHRGLIVKEDDQAVHLLNNAHDPTDVLVIPKADIDRREKEELSMMPSGMLVTFELDEILDLIAYIRAGGKHDDEIYQE
jgi:hypothetical protein